MKQVFRIFFEAEDTRPFIVLLCLLLGGAAEAASVGTMLPAATAMAGGDSPGSSHLNEIIRGFVQSSGLAPTLANLVLIVIALMVLKSLLSFAAMSYVGVSAARVSNALRRRLIKSIFDAHWSFYADQSGGRFANAISNDATRAGDAYILASQVVANAVQVVAYSAVGVLVNWRIAIAGLVIGSAISLVTAKLIRITRRAGFRQTDNTADLTVHLVDMLNNVKPLKTMDRYDAMLKAMTATLRKIKRTLVARELARNGLYQANDALMAIVVGAGIYFAHTSWQVPLPELALSGVVFFQIIGSVSKLQKFVLQSAQVESAYIRAMELIALAESKKENKSGAVKPVIGKSCRFENVSFSHPGTPVLRNVSLEFPTHGITVLSGPSGSGKTTIIDLLIGLNAPSSGKIFIGSTPIEQVDITAWRRKIGYVPQELSLLHANIRTNISLGDAAISDERIIAAIELAGAGSFLASLPNGLDTDVGEMGGKLSGGQRQRLSLARAFVSQPEILILDEVTSALDPGTEAEIISNIAALGGRYTVVSITHRPAWTRIADRLYDVAHGKVTLEEPRVEKAKSALRKTARPKI